MSDEQTYHKFADWLGSTWWELTESEYMMPMIQSYISLEEAKLMTDIPFASKSIEEIAAIKNMEPERLSPLLDNLARKGFVYKTVRNESIRYRLNDSFFTFLRSIYWPGSKNKETQASAPIVNKYFLDGWADQYNDVHHQGLRVLPIEHTIGDTKQILPFEDIQKIIDEFGYYTVSTCPCRHRHNLDPDMADCKHPTEVCLHFDELGHYIVENGMGREITKEETLEILKKAADSGLVHGISTWKNKPDTICNCCSCCCMWFEKYHKLNHKKNMDPSNYTVHVTPETCKGCALCVKRCPVDAIQLKVSDKVSNKVGKAAVVDTHLCIGCGVCAHKCPTDSLYLNQNKETTEPPENPRKYMEMYFSDRMAAQAKQKRNIHI